MLSNYLLLGTFCREFAASNVGKLVDFEATTTGDHLEEEEEELKRKIELEEEERKLEETLEYQRRVEYEAKQKHLAEQIKNSSGNHPETFQESFSVDSGPKFDILASNDHSQAILHGNAAACSKSIQFGDFDSGETIMDHQNPQSNRSNTFCEEKLTYSQVQMLGKYNNSYETGVEEMQTFSWSIQTENRLGGVKVNGVDRSTSTGKSSAHSNAKKTKKTDNKQPHSKYKQGLI